VGVQVEFGDSMEIIKGIHTSEDFEGAVWTVLGDSLRDRDWKQKLLSDDAPESAPPSSECAFLARQKALAIHWDSRDKQAKWQNYWLSCCRSSKCDYFFAVLLQHGVDREQDILAILSDPSFTEQVDPGGLAHYLRLHISYLLRRYSWCRARQLWWAHRSQVPLFGLVNLLLPRLFGSILLGMVLLLSSQEVWELPTRLAHTTPALYILLPTMLLASALYLLSEHSKHTEYRHTWRQWRELLSRPGLVLLIGLVESLAISTIVVLLVMPALGVGPGPLENPIDATPFAMSPGFWVTWASFAIAALFIGIFLQIFWEKETAAEPL